MIVRRELSHTTRSVMSIAEAICVDRAVARGASVDAITGKIEKNLPFFTAGYRN